uniref:Uncharacterized protein n=1 Tax=Picea glauca TaxID=3330 RepID=A0A117NHG9_PICGL|nr:hypothetical protein ABT39_MTgene5368 [Picea glauca]QHR88963.1 hypothetical protein Q903MT_gene2982 [Picea sitchensis]
MTEVLEELKLAMHQPLPLTLSRRKLIIQPGNPDRIIDRYRSVALGLLAYYAAPQSGSSYQDSRA